MPPCSGHKLHEAEADEVRAETDRNVTAAVVGQRENELDLAGKILGRTRQLFQHKSVAQNQLDKDQSAEQTAVAILAVARAHWR